MQVERWPLTWDQVVEEEKRKPYWTALRSALEEERATVPVYPPESQELEALRLCPLDKVKVVIIGQDPYPYYTAGAAHGLAFSTKGSVIPPSLERIFMELNSDIGVPIRGNGDLTSWAENGALLLNTILTVRDGLARSHAGFGWEFFTRRIIRVLTEREAGCGWLLMGRDAQMSGAPAPLSKKHAVVHVAHPSLRSTGFLGSRCFSKLDAHMMARGLPLFDWMV